MKKYLTYLACPYSSPSDLERSMRFQKVTYACRTLMTHHNWNVFSPITHSHPLHEIGMNGDWAFWKKVDTQYLKLSKRMVVFMLPGWEKSVGVTAEIKIAKKLKLPVLYMDHVTHRLSKHP